MKKKHIWTYNIESDRIFLFFLFAMCFRKLLLTVGIVLLASYTFAPINTKAQSWDPEFDIALQWMYEVGMTKYNTSEQYDPQAYLTREQWAKFFSVFMDEVVQKNNWALEKDWCDFLDKDKVDVTLVDSVLRSCDLWLFRWTKWNFLPKEALTKAQALTVLIRSLEWMQDESKSPRWKQYHDRSVLLWLTKERDVWNLDKSVSRYEMALLLYRAVHDDIDPNLLDLQELEQLLIELWLQKS